ncbi:DUF2163 domain-containing protein [Salinarimonas soli]|uniref:DUF2163 domain-containing protein n=1 Tax=Salinarimonas soli TaxID=1638099 RepID=A0A5B2VFK9_9HYPH|nr:DUF2163 domain-containing protein [Salinarimonas soli]KAA2237250.1 DUF2163 domain-containing protein [Salinarimonas soli]
MRTLSPELAARLGRETASLCRCWALIRRDGAVLGFTDHDRDVAFAGRVHAARTGLDAAEATSELGFAVGGGEVAGALTSAGITEDDLAAGLYDDASVETWLVDWAEPEHRLLLDVAHLGEIRRADGAFVAELRGLMHRLDEERGRLYGAACSADLGDARCRVDLSAPALRHEGAVASTDGALEITAPALAGYAPGLFTGGRLRWTAGLNAGTAVEVRAHRGGSLSLWQRAARPIGPGDTFQVTAGCDKSLSTCRDRFANATNFRGFPHMPGTDFLLRGAG